jgi:hypothetical protein
MEAMSFIADVRHGQLIHIDPSAWTLGLRKVEGKRIGIRLEEFRKSRSAQQNRYYHGVVCAIMGDELGYTGDEAHHALQIEHLGKADPKTGLIKVKSTTELSTVEFEDYMATIREWAYRKYQINIPLPNEYSVDSASPL